ncbi:MAG: deoxyribonuclease V [Phycisphaerales bacterium]|nr:deoxyribonuclease V [Phycisphaerales bacterium]
MKRLHRWPRTPKAAIALQRALAGGVVQRPIADMPRLIGGLDCAFSRDERTIFAAAVTWDAVEQRVVEQRVVRRALRFPYVPGLLSFRETPAILGAFSRLRTRPEVVLCDGQGLAHPRRLGLACHVGLWLELPTIGCAKSRLCGEHDEPGAARGDWRPLRLRGDAVGGVLRTRERVKPMFISPGHGCDVESAIRIVLAATTRYRMPEPTRLADQVVNAARRAADGAELG